MALNFRWERIVTKWPILRVLMILLLIILAAVGVWRLYPGLNRPNDNQLLLYGNVDIREADLAFNNSEHIERLLVQEGDRVRKGQLLAVLHRERLQADVAAAEARVGAQTGLTKNVFIDALRPAMALMLGVSITGLPVTPKSPYP